MVTILAVKKTLAQDASQQNANSVGNDIPQLAVSARDKILVYLVKKGKQDTQPGRPPKMSRRRPNNSQAHNRKNSEV
tara:strand:+ start:120 stop:350 length:231 start_codon:yes stop_codon:yes gene_type:complete